MKTFADIVRLCKGEQGKVFIMDEAGELQLVVLSGAEFEKIKAAATSVEVDPDLVNREVARARLAEESMSRNQASASVAETRLPRSVQTNPYPSAPPPQVASNGLPKQPDLREEVIDPSFDFDTPEDL